MKYLIFRNDRIGDFFIIAPLIKAIKREDINAKIFIVCSNKNIELVRNIDYIDGCFLFKKKNLIARLKFFLLLRKEKFDRIIVSDKKNRSIIFSLFLASKEKIFNVSKKFQYKIIKIFYNNVFLDNDSVNDSTYEILKLNAKCFGFDINKNDKIVSKILTKDNNFINFLDKSKNKILLHLDEKWNIDEYSIEYKQAKKLTNIRINIKEILNFANTIYAKSNYEMIITTGAIKTSIFEQLKEVSELVNNNLYRIKIKHSYIYLVDKLDLFKMIELIALCRTFISCHGAFTHIAHNYGLYIYDIIEKEKLDHYSRITKHMDHYKSIYRKEFSSISEEIISKL